MVFASLLLPLHIRRPLVPANDPYEHISALHRILSALFRINYAQPRPSWSVFLLRSYGPADLRESST